MMPRTDKAAYRRHAYSGPRKSRKRVRAALKYFTGETSRNVVWRSKQERNVPPHNQDDGCCDLNERDTKVIKTYECLKPKIPLDSTDCAPSSSKLQVEPEPKLEPVDVIWLQPDPEVESYQQTIDKALSNSLSGLTGYHIVDLKHVIQWAFLLERHRANCESSQIEFVSEEHNGYQSDLTYKCSMCDETWKYNTASSNKINNPLL